MARRGRPPHKPTAAWRRKVEELRSCGMSEDAVARAMGLDVDTLRKHYADELANGAARKRAQIIAMLYKSASKGNVSAQKKLEEMSRAAIGAQALMGEAPVEASKPVKLGKKEQAAAIAREAAAPGNKFAPPPPPRLVVNND